QTKFGIEVMLNSRDAALEKLFKHLGLYEKDNGQRVDPLASLLHTIASGNASGFKPVAQDPEHED
ncbi:MAG: terminase small subunit, partial [Burkholderiales bacterium]